LSPDQLSAGLAAFTAEHSALTVTTDDYGAIYIADGTNAWRMGGAQYLPVEMLPVILADGLAYLVSLAPPVVEEPAVTPSKTPPPVSKRSGK
jgi:hypothetical protein